uniref:F-box domain-containing protein n=1 Tax=Compsopogon caeruleus TaxID=31354 RepID=A0A7S1XHN9_9RHOD|mmetsp:Transcript_9391/g.19210  ORF Transcript_9391/g.19210 Transcript_9391/m.19210 type:complete len:416 (+) Transcript_9391:1129-2376(+)
MRRKTQSGALSKGRLAKPQVTHEDRPEKRPKLVGPDFESQLIQLPSDVIHHICRFLLPHERLSLTLACKSLYGEYWLAGIRDHEEKTKANQILLEQFPPVPKSDPLWTEMCESIQRGYWGTSLGDKFEADNQRRNIQYVDDQGKVLNTVYGLCCGCGKSPSGLENITGLSLCKTCFRQHEILGVTCKTNAKQRYRLNDLDIDNLGERSAVIELDTSRQVVHRVHFYHRCLRRKAYTKYGGPQGLDVERRKWKEIRKKRNLTIAQRRTARTIEIRRSFEEKGMVLEQSFARMYNENLSRCPFFYPWELELDYAIRRYIDQTKADFDEIRRIRELAELKQFFHMKTSYAAHFQRVVTALGPSAGLSAVQLNAFNLTVDEIMSDQCLRGSVPVLLFRAVDAARGVDPRKGLVDIKHFL